MRPCSEAQQNCDAPANLIGAYTRGTCFYCAQPVCGQCSQRITYGRHGRVRIGDDCLIEVWNERGAQIVMTKLYQNAGYTDPHAAALAHIASLPDGVLFYREKDAPS